MSRWRFYIALIPEAFQTGGETALFSWNGDKLQPAKAKPQSGRPQCNFCGLEHLLDFCEFWESPQFIPEWPRKISTLSCLFFSLIYWQGTRGRLLKSKSVTPKFLFLASCKARTSANVRFTFLSDNSLLELSGCCFLCTGPELSRALQSPHQLYSLTCLTPDLKSAWRQMVQESSHGQPWCYVKISKSGHIVF